MGGAPFQKHANKGDPFIQLSECLIMSFHKLVADDSTHFPLHRSTLPGYKVMSQYTHSFIHWPHPGVTLCSKMLWMRKGDWRLTHRFSHEQKSRVVPLWMRKTCVPPLTPAMCLCIPKLSINLLFNQPFEGHLSVLPDRPWRIPQPWDVIFV